MLNYIKELVSLRKPTFVLATILFLGLLALANQYFGLKSLLLEYNTFNGIQILSNIFYYSIAPLGVLGIHFYFYPHPTSLIKTIAITCMVTVCYALSVSLVPITLFTSVASNYVERDFIYKTVPYGTRVSMALLLMGICGLYWKREAVNFWGLLSLPRSIAVIRPLLIVIPIVIAVFSFSPSLNNFYPMFFHKGMPEVFGMPFIGALCLYEIFYLLGFVGIELMFRGLMLRMLFPLIGWGSLYISSALYFVAHFGKPYPELISSFFGGLILCYIAQKTKTLWSGILLHITVAFCMDFFSVFHRVW
ncbi:MAG: CPBP family intramembrane metalloprotease [Fibrobacterales bacterium]